MSAFTKEQRTGYTVKSKSTGRVTGKLPFFCPRSECNRITSTIDDAYLKEYGVCANCYVTLVEDRKEPLIDVEAYRRRLEDRGY